MVRSSLDDVGQDNVYWMFCLMLVTWT